MFQTIKKLHKPVGQGQFVAFEKFRSNYLFRIAREESFGYLLIIYIQFNFDFLYCLELIGMLSANQNVEILACMLQE